MNPRARWVEDPRTFFVPVSRESLRTIPFKFIVHVCLDAPVLVFREADEGWASKLRGRIEMNWTLYRRSSDPERRKGFATYIRKQWVTLVSLAVGYTWPGNPPGHIEFAPDPSGVLA